jgi:hypothetical protein
MCQKLDIGIIAAKSPQAKGGTRRGTHQDRLIKKMGRKKIGTHEAANEFLQQHCLPEHNAHFARSQSSGRTITARLRRRGNWSRCSAWRRSGAFPMSGRCATRIAIFDWRGAAPRQAKVTVCEWEYGRIEIRYQAKARPHREIAAPEPIGVAVATEKPPKGSRWKPSADHPWKRPGPPGMLGAATSAAP